VAVQLVGKHVDSTVNNPIEAVAQWRAGQLRALCVFDEKRMPYPTKITQTQSWQDVPTCKEAGVPTAYTMLRGIFMAPGVTKDQTQFFVDLMKKVRETPEWKDYMEKGAFNQTAMEGEAFTKWLGTAEQQHRDLMKAAGFIAQ
jgi:tripartite-type tricarboxylate transporter receptor subunit TctC